MVAGMIDKFGTPEQRQKFLPGLCTMEARRPEALQIRFYVL
jgi:alkylation response protein AidB-like acyl-CoA dehydrogenase